MRKDIGIGSTLWRLHSLHISVDGEASLGSIEIRQLNAIGIRQAAAVDTAKTRHFEVFSELSAGKAAALLDPFFQFDRVESLPVEADLIRITHILNALGLKTEVADGWMILREFQLLDDEGQPNPPGIRRLIRQLQQLSGSTVTSFEDLEPDVLRRILKFWDEDGVDPRASTILSPTDAVALSD